MKNVIARAMNTIHKVELVEITEGKKKEFLVRNCKRNSTGRGPAGDKVVLDPKEAFRDFRKKVTHRQSSDHEKMKMAFPCGKGVYLGMIR
mgnify:CR=1 FL=1